MQAPYAEKFHIFASGCNYLLSRTVRDTGINRKRAEALYYVYRRGLAEGRFATMFEAAKWCVRQPAPYFYISSKRASILVGKLLAGEPLSKFHSSTRRMARRLHADYLRYLEEHPDNTLSRERIMELLVDRPAPEFYISSERARKILREERKRRRKRIAWLV